MSEYNTEIKWVAFIKKDDPLLAKHDVSSTPRCQLQKVPHLPLFEVTSNGEHLRFIDPRDILFAFGADRVVFLWEGDRRAFAEELSDVLKERDSFERNGRNVLKGISVLVLLGAAVVGGMFIVRHMAKNRII